MKTTLKKVLIPAKLLCLTNNVWKIVCLTEKDGKVVAKSKMNVYSHEPYPCYSVSKSTVSLALGFLYDKGLFKPSDRIVDHLGEYFTDSVDKRWADVTIDHVLHHKTGMVSDESLDAGLSDFDDGEAAWSKQDNLEKIFSCPIINTPGEVFKYSDANYYVLARIAEKYCGTDLCMFLAKNLFEPLGFANYTWTRDVNGHVMGGTGLMLRTEDFAKMGWLWLNKGTYEGVRYISEEWMTMGLSAVPDKGNVKNYGFGVRRLSEKGYSITGAFGQGLYFNIDKKFVYAWNARRTNLVMTLCEILDKLNVI